MKNKNKNRKRALFISSVMLVIALLITGTFAWQDYSQHKSNEFNTASVEHNVVLVEDFEPVENWRVNEQKDKTIFVRNGSSDDPEGVYDIAYIRLQLKEYMDISKRDYEYSEHRYLIDTTGDFIRFETEEEAQSYIDDPDNGLASKTSADIEKVISPFDKKKDGYYYIKSNQGDANGQYGKHVVVSVKTGDYVPVIEGSSRVDATTATSEHHKAGDSEECNYPTHIWKEDQNGLISSSPIDEYVSLGLGSDVVTLGEYESLSQDRKDAGVWVLDTSNDLGYAYWNQGLKHASDGSDGKTKNFLNDVTLLKQPKDSAYYVLHVDMEAISFDDLNHWYNMPETLANEWGTEVYQGTLTVSVDGDIKAGSPKKIQISGETPDKKEIKEFDVQVEGSHDPKYEQGEIITSELEEGPITITVKPKDKTLSLSKTITVNVSPFQAEIIEVDDETIIPQYEGTTIKVEPRNDRYTYKISQNTSSKTKISDKGEIIIADDETADQITVSVYLGQKEITKQTLKVARVEKIEFKHSVEKVIYRNQDVDFSAQLTANKYQKDKSIRYYLEEKNRRVTGVTIDEKTGILHADHQALINTPFNVVAESVANPNKKVVAEDVMIQIDNQEIDKMTMSLDKDRIKPGDSFKVEVQFEKEGKIVENVPYEISTSNSTVTIDHNSISIPEDFRDQNLTIKVTTTGLKENIVKEQTIDLSQLLAIEINLLENVENGKKIPFEIKEDRIGVQQENYEFSFDQVSESLSVIYENQQYYLVVANDAPFVTVKMTAASKQDPSINDVVEFTIEKNQDFEQVVGRIEVSEAEITSEEGKEIELSQYVTVYNFYGEQIEDLSTLDIELLDTTLSTIEGTSLIVGNYEKERKIAVRFSQEQVENTLVVDVKPRVAGIVVDYSSAYRGDQHKLTARARGYYIEKLDYPEIEFKLNNTSGETKDGSYIDPKTQTLHISASETSLNIHYRAKVAETSITASSSVQVYYRPEEIKLKILNPIEEGVDYRQGLSHQYKAEVVDLEGNKVNQSVKFELKTLSGEKDPETNLRYDTLYIAKNQTDAVFQVIASTGINKDLQVTNTIRSSLKAVKIEALSDTVTWYYMSPNQIYNFHFKAKDENGLVLNRDLTYHISGNTDPQTKIVDGLITVGKNELADSFKVWATLEEGETFIESPHKRIYVETGPAFQRLVEDTVPEIMRPGDSASYVVEGYYKAGTKDYPEKLPENQKEYIVYGDESHNIAEFNNGKVSIYKNAPSKKINLEVSFKDHYEEPLFYKSVEIRGEIASIKLRQEQETLYPNQTILLEFDAKDRYMNQLDYVNRPEKTKREFNVISGSDSVIIKDNLLTVVENPKDDYIEIQGSFSDPLTKKKTTKAIRYNISKKYHFNPNNPSVHKRANSDEEFDLRLLTNKQIKVPAQFELTNTRPLAELNQETGHILIKYSSVFCENVKMTLEDGSEIFFVVPINYYPYDSIKFKDSIPESIDVPSKGEVVEIPIEFDFITDFIADKNPVIKYRLYTRKEGVSFDEKTGILKIDDTIEHGTAVGVSVNVYEEDGTTRITSSSITINVLADEYQGVYLDYDESQILTRKSPIDILSFGLIDKSGDRIETSEIFDFENNLNTDGIHSKVYEYRNNNQTASKGVIEASGPKLFEYAYLEFFVKPEIKFADSDYLYENFVFNSFDIIYTNLDVINPKAVYQTDEIVDLRISNETIGNKKVNIEYTPTIRLNYTDTDDLEYVDGRIRFVGEMEEGEKRTYTIYLENNINYDRSNTIEITFEK